MAVMSSANQLSTLTGISGASSMTLFEIGDDQVVTRLSRLRVGYQTAPTSASVAGSAKMSRGEAYAAGGSGEYAAGKFDLRQSGRFHQATVSAVGRWAAAVVDFDLSSAGQR